MRTEIKNKSISAERATPILLKAGGALASYFEEKIQVGAFAEYNVWKSARLSKSDSDAEKLTCQPLSLYVTKVKSAEEQEEEYFGFQRTSEILYDLHSR